MACVALVAISFQSCTILRSARGAQSVFMREEDPVLAAVTFPLLIKASEILLAGSPRDQSALVMTASLYVMYGSAFVQGEAEFLPDSRYEEKQAAMVRSGTYFVRARRLLEPALEKRVPGLLAALSAPGGKTPAATALLRKLLPADLPLIYWTMAALLSQYALDPLDLENARVLRVAPPLLERAEELVPGWNEGAVQELLVSLYSSLPDYLGGGMDKAEAAWNKAFSYSKGRSASLYLARALSFAVPNDDYASFRKNLELALAVDVSSTPDSRLATELAKRRARRVLAAENQYFLTIPSGSLP